MPPIGPAHPLAEQRRAFPLDGRKRTLQGVAVLHQLRDHPRLETPVEPGPRQGAAPSWNTAPSMPAAVAPA